MNDNNTKLHININSFDELELAREAIVKFCRQHCTNVDDIDIIEMAILEASHNAIRYG